jgi:hypothetical protein
VVDYRVNILV